MNNIKILKDQALGKRENDRFGYSDIADNLIELIKGLEAPFTIGLYGPWGVGKSTICKIVEQELEKTADFRVFYFDTWKYERDSFRRQFLITLDEKLFSGELNYRETLNQSLTLPQTLPFKEALKRNFNSSVSTIANKFIIFVLLFILAFAIVFGANYFFGFLNSTYTDILKSIIDAVFSDIKTFLAGDNVEEMRNKSVFLIPCDNEAISRQLKRSYYEELDTEEYLRKFFNLSFKIPKLLDLELDDYVEEKLKESGIPEFINNHSVSFVISRAFRNNPREIIQFINSLILVYLLAKKRVIESITAKEKVPFLAKILVMRVRWPEIYDAVENEMVRSAATVKEIVDARQVKKVLKYPYGDWTHKFETLRHRKFGMIRK